MAGLGGLRWVVLFGAPHQAVSTFSMSDALRAMMPQQQCLATVGRNGALPCRSAAAAGATRRARRWHCLPWSRADEVHVYLCPVM